MSATNETIPETLPAPRRPNLESTEHVWISVLAAGFVLMALGAISSAAPAPLDGAIVAALGVLGHAVEVATGPGERTP